MGWVSGFTYRKAITISHANIDADLTNFPITLVLTSSNHAFSSCRSDGYDVVFTSSDETTQIYFEREYYDSTNSKARFHIKIPSVTAASDTTFYMYYGDSGASDSSYHSAGDVWDSNYIMVQHMGDSLTDSTGNGNDGTATGTTVVDTEYGKARSFNGSSDKVSVAKASFTNSSDISSAMTVLINAKPANLTQTQKYLWEVDTTGESESVIWEYVNNTYEFFAVSYSGADPRTSSQIEDSSGSDVVICYGHNGTSQKVCKDGSVSTLTKSFSLASSAINTHIIGASVSGNYFGGTIYEFRLSNSLRSDAWVKAESSAMKISLTTIGAEQTNGSTPTVTRRFAQII